MAKNEINLEKGNLCDSCQHSCFLSQKGKDDQEVRCYKCQFSEKHSYKVEECPHYYNPNAFQRFLQNKLAVTFTALILITIIIGLIIIIT